MPQSQLKAENNKNKSEVFLLGEVAYLGDRVVNLSTAIHVERQTVVFRVIEIFKGKMDVEYVKVALQISDATNGLSIEKYRVGNKFILNLKNDVFNSSCTDLTSDWEFKVKPEFLKFEKYPCYFENSTSVVVADNKKIEKVKSKYKKVRKDK